MTRLIGSLLVIIILLALFVPSCSSEDDSTASEVIKVTIDNGIIKIKDSLDRVITLDEAPQRLVSLSPSNTEILYALGLEEKLVGVTSYCNYPIIDGEKPSDNKPNIGGFSTPDYEKVIAQNPDLILAANKHRGEVVSQLESYGLNVIVLAPGTIDEVLQTIHMVGRITGVESKARQLTEEMQNKIDTITNLVKELPDDDKPTIFYALRSDPLQTIGYDTVQSHVIETAGGKNLFYDLTEYPQVDLEALIERNPDFILANVKHGSIQQTTLDWAQTEDRIENTSARKNNNIFSFDSDLISRPGPRIVDAVEEMLRIIHPNLAEKLQ